MEVSTSFSKILLILFAVYIFSAQTFDQELCLHETENHNGNFYCFRHGVPDTSKYAMEKVKSVCLKGIWLFYNAVNYSSYQHSRASSTANEAQSCSFVRESFESVKSFRFLGPKDVSWQANIVLYPGAHWEGREYTINSQSFGDIKEPIVSLASTGNANWTLWEGPHFDGKSLCWQSPQSMIDAGTHPSSTHLNRNFHFTANVMETNELSTVGSVNQGCAVEPVKPAE